MDFALLAAYVLLPLVAYVRSRSLAWTVIAVAVAVSFAGAVVGFVIDNGGAWTRPQLQLVLLAALVVVAALALFRRPAHRAPWRPQVLGIGLPLLLLVVFLFVAMTFWTDNGAFNTPVNFLLGHSLAEDNAKWLDFTAQLATGDPIRQSVAMGGPLQLVLVFVGTAMGAISQIALGGFNEVAVAANTVVYGQFLLVAIAPLALAPLAEMRLRNRTGSQRYAPIPAPFLWLAALVIVSANLIATGYGHLTFQFVVLLAVLWSATFLANLPMRHARLLVTLAVAIAMIVWVPFNVLAVVILLAVPVLVVGRGIRHGRWDWVGLLAWVFTAAMLLQALKSSLFYALAISASAPETGGGAVRGVTAVVRIGGGVFAGLADSELFRAGGGTDQVQPILAILAAAAGLGAIVVAARQRPRYRLDAYVRLLPVGLLVGMALGITVLDSWVTGSGPHYGSMKYMFMVAIVVTATGLPLALTLLDPAAGRRMSVARWAGVGIVIVLLAVDTLLPRAVAAARPEQWSAQHPFGNEQPYWWPAEVNGTGDQPIASNPIGCVYLPRGVTAPSALLPTEWYDLQQPQRIYSCTRLLAGLSGADSSAQALVDWQRNEWLSNTPSWDDAYASLWSMPESVLDQPVIALDEVFNVVGLDSLRTLLDKYPPTTS